MHVLTLAEYSHAMRCDALKQNGTHLKLEVALAHLVNPKVEQNYFVCVCDVREILQLLNKTFQPSLHAKQRLCQFRTATHANAATTTAG